MGGVCLRREGEKEKKQGKIWGWGFVRGKLGKPETRGPPPAPPAPLAVPYCGEGPAPPPRPLSDFKGGGGPPPRRNGVGRVGNGGERGRERGWNG